MGKMRDLFEAKQERDKALALVLGNSGEWRHVVQLYIAALPAGWTGTGEDIRYWVTERGCPEPHKDKAWGAAINAAAQAGTLQDTGRIARMKAAKSHARRYPVWIRT